MSKKHEDTTVSLHPLTFDQAIQRLAQTSERILRLRRLTVPSEPLTALLPDQSRDRSASEIFQRLNR